MSIASNLANDLNDGLIDESVQDIVKTYIKWWQGYGKDGKHVIVKTPEGFEMVINTQEDIDRGNLVLDKVLESLGFTPKKYD